MMSELFTGPVITGVLVYLLIGVVVNFKCLSGPGDFSWGEFLNPFKGWFLPTKSEAYLQSVFFTAPFWPVFLWLHILSRRSKDS